MKRRLRYIVVAVICLFMLFCTTGCKNGKISRQSFADTKESQTNNDVFEIKQITKILIQKTTEDGHFYKEFISKDDISSIHKILVDTIGAEIQDEVKATGGRTFGIVLYDGKNNSVVISSYSDTIIQIGEKYYSVLDSEWADKILEYYDISEIVELEYK